MEGRAGAAGAEARAHPGGRRRGKDTAAAILDVAERLVQSRGFNGFSYADIAAELGVTKASLHYHFASKADLGEALMTRYASRFAEALATIDATTEGAPSRLDAYVDLYAGVLEEHRMCLCGMLAAEYQTLPAQVRKAVIAFIDDNERWLERVLEQGSADGSVRVAAPARDIARTIVSALEGAMLLARPYDDPERFRASARRLLVGLAGPAPRDAA